MEETKQTLIEHDGQSYMLKFSLDAIDKIETVTKRSILEIIHNSGGFPKVNEMRAMFVFGLLKADTQTLQSQPIAISIFNAILKEKGYNHISMLLTEAIQRDCDFFFQNA